MWEYEVPFYYISKIPKYFPLTEPKSQINSKFESSNFNVIDSKFETWEPKMTIKGVKYILAIKFGTL